MTRTETNNRPIRAILEEAGAYVADTIIDEAVDTALTSARESNDHWTEATVQGLVSSMKLAARQSTGEMRQYADRLEAFLDTPQTKGPLHDPVLEDVVSVAVDAVRKAADARGGGSPLKGDGYGFA